MKMKWKIVHIPMIDYQSAWDLQIALVDAKKTGENEFPDVLLLLEHPPVYTLGRRGGSEHLRVERSFLESRGVSIVGVERGGEITYHGPGQLVGYPITDLRRSKWKVVDFVGALEEMMIRTVADWGIEAGRNDLNRGAWVGMQKIGSVGIAVRRSITFHGFALNVNTNLEYFDWIHPCGLQGISAVSMERLLNETVPMDAVRSAAEKHAKEIFNVELEHMTEDRLRHILDDDIRARAGGHDG